MAVKEIIFQANKKLRDPCINLFQKRFFRLKVNKLQWDFGYSGVNEEY
jgi:hypothetical protein